jgi:hypothetical protein
LGGDQRNSDYYKELNDAKDKDEAWSSKEVSDYRFGQGYQEKSLFESYSHKKEFEKEKDPPKINLGGLDQSETGSQTRALPINKFVVFVASRESNRTIQAIKTIIAINFKKRVYDAKSKKRP